MSEQNGHLPEPAEPGKIKKIGRPLGSGRHGLYSKALSEREQDVYEECYGDISVLHELALLRALMEGMLQKRAAHDAELARLRLGVPKGGKIFYAEEDGELRPLQGHELDPYDELGLIEEDEEEDSPRKKRLQRGVTEGDLLAVAEKILRAAQVAHDQMVGRRIRVEFSDSDVAERVKNEVRQFAAELFLWLKECLCPECKVQFRQELERRRTIEVEQ